MSDLRRPRGVCEVLLADPAPSRMADEIDLVGAGPRADCVDELVQRLGAAGRASRVVVVYVDPGGRISVAREQPGRTLILFAGAGEPMHEDDRSERFVCAGVHVP